MRLKRYRPSLRVERLCRGTEEREDVGDKERGEMGL